MTARTLVELASKLGCSNAMELLLSRHYRAHIKGLRLFRENEEIWLEPKQQKDHWFIGYSNGRFRKIRLTNEMAQDLTITERDYRRILDIPFEINEGRLFGDYRNRAFEPTSEQPTKKSDQGNAIKTILVVGVMALGIAITVSANQTKKPERKA